MKKITLLLLFILLISTASLALSITNTTISTTTASNSIFLNDTITLNFFNVTSTNISLDGIDTYNARIDNKNAGLTYIYLFNISSTYNKIRYNGDSATDATLTSGSIITLQAAPYYIQISNFTTAGNGGSGGSGSSGGGGGGSSGGTTTVTTTLATDYEATLGESTALSFTVAATGEKHKVTIYKVTDGVVTIIVESTPQRADLTIGQTKEFDLDGDKEADIAITLIDVIRNKANLRIVSLIKETKPELIFPNPSKTDYEQLPPIDNPPAATGSAVKSVNPLTRFRSFIPWVMMLLIAGLIVYGYFFITKTRRNT